MALHGRSQRRATRRRSTWLLLLSALIQSSGFTATTRRKNGLSFHQVTRRSRRHWMQSSENSDWNDNLRRLKDIQEQGIESDLIDALFSEDSASSGLMTLELRGQAKLPVASTDSSEKTALPRTVLVLTPQKSSSKRTKDDPQPSLLLPLESANQLKLVSFAVAQRPLSKSVLLGLNTLLVNRDDALFDNIPWSTWSIDPQMRNRDAAGNNILERFHLGKRDAFNRFLGKDWQGKSLAIGNLALRLKYLLEDIGEVNKSNRRRQGEEEEESRKTLATRIAQLSIRELMMEEAELQSQLAILQNNPMEDYNDPDLEGSLARVQAKRNQIQKELDVLQSDPETVETFIHLVLDQVAEWTTKDGQSAAPYRGANGYAPTLDSKFDVDSSYQQYTNPYDLLREILRDQLNAKVIGCVLENTSLLRGNTVLGGTIILQRTLPLKKTKVNGISVNYTDVEETYGNEGVLPGETIIVECDSDEAVSIASAFRIPLKVESSVLDTSTVLAQPTEARSTDHIIDELPMWAPTVPLSLQVEGEPEPFQATSPVSIPRSTSQLFENIFEPKSPGSSPASLYPTDNPIKSLDELDDFSNADKAKTLLEMSNFSGRLPRPRTVRSAQLNPLDDLLLPLIDESVRRQFRIREAEQQGDFGLAEELRAESSKRQRAKEQATIARETGNEELADQWESEADFLETLRADVTQDEGSYSRFLDADEWYERDRQKTANRAKKSSFGNLLDGIE